MSEMGVSKLLVLKANFSLSPGGSAVSRCLQIEREREEGMSYVSVDELEGRAANFFRSCTDDLVVVKVVISGPQISLFRRDPDFESLESRRG